MNIWNVLVGVAMTENADCENEDPQATITYEETDYDEYIDNLKERD